jgi:hypothetical protein
MIPIGTAARVYLVTITALIGLLTAAIGVWCLIDPRSFAESVGFPAHEHFVHDVGAFQVGLGVILLLALIWSDALATALAGYIVGNTVHTVNHFVDLDLGGSALQAWALGAASVVLVIAFVLRLRQLGYVLGNVSVATDRRLVPFVRQKTIRLTTFRKDGTAGTSPVSIAVDGDRASDQGTPHSAQPERRIRFGDDVRQADRADVAGAGACAGGRRVSTSSTASAAQVSRPSWRGGPVGTSPDAVQIRTDDACRIDSVAVVRTRRSGRNGRHR